MKTATFLGLVMALAGAFPSEAQQVARFEFREEQALAATKAGYSEAARQSILSGSQTAASENGPQRIVVDPKVVGLEKEFERAATPEEYGKARAHALALIADADKTNNALISFQSAVTAADCTYFSVPEAQQSQNGVWAKVEVADLHEAALRYTDAVKQNWFESRPWYERYANLLQASAYHIMEGESSVARPDLKILLRQLAADAEKTIPTTFNYRVMVNKWDNVETDTILARLSWRYGSRDVARGRLQYAIDETRHDGRIDLWLQLEEERYKNEKSVDRPAVPLRQLREEARLGAQGLREKYSSRAGRIWVNALFDQAYGLMLKDQMWEKGATTPAELFRSTESLKARMLLDELSTPPTELAEPYRSEAETLEADILGFSRDTSENDPIFLQEIKLISRLSPFGTGGSESKRRASLVQLEHIYQNADAGFARAARPTSLERVQNALQPRESILEYVIPYDPLYRDQYLSIFWISRDRFVPVLLKLDDIIPWATNTGSFSVDGRAPITLSPLSIVIATLREQIRTDNDKAARANLNDLYRVLIQPVVMRGLKLEDYDRLIVVPHGPLHYLPFGALLDGGGKFLVEKTAVTIVPSASVWLLLQEKSGAVTRNFVAFGNPLLTRPDLPSLQAAESEVSRIADELDIPGADAKHVYVRDQATEERFLRDGPNASLLHIAAHGEFPDENALDRHAVILAAGSTDDGVLRAATIRKLRLSSNRLVVLSVCNGGLYRIGPADEPYGLIPAFLQAGSHNVVGTLWKVEDIYGRLLMAEFYKSVLEVGPAEALRRASEEFIRQGQTISRWSGFLSVGSGRPFQ